MGYFLVFSPTSYVLAAILLGLSAAGSVLHSMGRAWNKIQMRRSDRWDAIVRAQHAAEDALVLRVAGMPEEWQRWAYGNAVAWGEISPARMALFQNPVAVQILDDIETAFCRP